MGKDKPPFLPILGTKSSWRPAHQAAQYGASRCLKMLIDAGAKPDDADDDGDTPVHCAVLNGHADCLTMLLDAGGKFDEDDDNGLRPVHYAAQEGHGNCLQVLILAGVEINRKEINQYTRCLQRF